MTALRHNAQQVRRLAPQSKIMAMLKADAYGHGLLDCARALQTQVDAVAVARLDEAYRLRQVFPQMPLLLTAASLDHDALIWCQAQQVAIVLHEDSVAERLLTMNAPPAVWLKLNSGMNRLGFAPKRFLQLAEQLEQRGVQPVLMTHFSSADEQDGEPTLQQIRAFDAAIQSLPAWPQSLANSAGLMAFPQARRDWVRPGLMLYGANPMAAGPQIDLRPVMRLKARVLSLNALSSGDAVGYGRRWVAGQAARVATVGIGYGDGYPRCEEAALQACLHGQRARLLGRVSMDMLALDVSAIEAVQVGDEVELWGENMAVDEVAQAVGSISYDLLCRVQARVPRRCLGGA